MASRQLGEWGFAPQICLPFSVTLILSRDPRSGSHSDKTIVFNAKYIEKLGQRMRDEILGVIRHEVDSTQTSNTNHEYSNQEIFQPRLFIAFSTTDKVPRP